MRNTILALALLPTMALSQTYQTLPTYNGGSITYGPNGQTWQTLPTYGGGSTTYGPGGQVYQTMPTYGGGSVTYGPGGYVDTTPAPPPAVTYTPRR
jgi:hypothetical protein